MSIQWDNKRLSSSEQIDYDIYRVHLVQDQMHSLERKFGKKLRELRDNEIRMEMRRRRISNLIVGLGLLSFAALIAWWAFR